MCEVNSRVQFHFDNFVCCELRPVVSRYGPYGQPVSIEQPHDGIGRRDGLLARVELLHEHEAVLPFHQGDNRSLAVLAHNGIHLPVAQSLAVGLGRPLVDGHAVRYRYPGSLRRVFGLLPATPEMLVDAVLIMRGAAGYPIVNG